MNLSERLFHSAAAEFFVIDEGQSIAGVYKRLSETKDLDTQMESALEAAGLATEEERAESMRIYCSNCDIYEKQGFINGLRYGVRLFHEIFSDPE